MSRPVLAWVLTTQDVSILRPHLKMLAVDYLCYDHLGCDRGTDPCCRLCQTFSNHPAPAEDMVHLLARCRATEDIRNRVLPDLMNILAKFHLTNRLLSASSHDHLTQFILDCSSLNLPNDIRVPPNHMGFISITKQCSCLVFAIHKERTRQLKAMDLLA